ncbi:MAG: transcription elongation factor GreA [Gammaproteobacteria bacterium]|jgi:transcription elongation factor GreA|nr:transcription elongation factor GreA [Pseudomonadota bacterium]MDA7563128.1 transcription elongation factor GreA [Gammaproteobacteria bacterium]MDO7561722.1 transcription elongation factor GreA [SAR86 cluster bacterium]MDA9021603.1 transcription elongation factor GreA [Gammaproteobacteria bacterium]MDA9079182.1 transcription elongation factor GreA [Gammaproteobacteria bacterium]|tara:strand:- start:232 stop:708 length:477 start_codon:yes stop_codon:yes gene_type:complete
MDKLPITKAGELKISKQLHQLKTKDRVEISQAIADARAHGDLKENAEYHAAKEEQGFIEAKIQEIEHALANAQVIDVKDIPETGRVVFGSTIDLYDIKNEKSLTYKIVGNLESDPSLGLISIQTPIAMGLLGKNEGDEVTISTPSGDISLEIEKVKHL